MDETSLRIQALEREIERLRTSEQLLHTLMDQAPYQVYFKDLESRFIWANRAVAQAFRLEDPSLVLGKSDFDFLPPELARRTREDEQEILRTGLPKVDLEEMEVQPDGSATWISTTKAPFRDAEGNLHGTFGISRDITVRKRAEEALRKSENNLRSLLDKLGEGFAIMDAEERWVFANPAAARIFGVAPGPLAGHHFREFVDENTYQEILRQTERRRRGESGTYEIEIRRPDGGRRRILQSVTPHLAADGTYLGAEGLFMDMTERHLAEEALRESQARYLELFNNTTDAIFWILVAPDGTFTVESFNPAEAARFGRDIRDLAGQSFHQFLPRELADPVVANFQRCLAAGGPIRYEEEVELPLGRRTFQTLLVPIRDGGGRITRIVGFSQDITQNKQAEEALRQTQKLESLGILAGGIAHDFNNLLTAMLGNLNLAQLTSPQESPALPYLDNIEHTILRAAELTKQMLAYSGRGRFVVRPHDLNQVVREMTHLLNVSISKKITVRYDLAGGLPPVEADAAQIQQVVMNLVTNASEAIGDQEGTIDIATRTHPLDEGVLRSTFAGQNLEAGLHVCLEISDTGCGIAPEIRDKIFDPFFSTKESGRGLGLCAMQGILRGHRAGIQIDSAPGKGTTFMLFFPSADHADLGPEPAAPGSEEPLPKRKILVVDDEAEVRKATAAMLEIMGLQVATAVDGPDALERFAAEDGHFDLVLLDLTMPRMDGRETFRELKRIRADVPVILCSGYSEHDAVQENRKEGFAGFLPKPFLIEDLRKILRQVP
ncbi:MAG TPA: PAS domain-containing protein [Holophaga sp.]|nr:PAS domain-containing protein [Holophaga sp.]HPS66489.1 PAS domain-containing protein [Holophaga sp.]